MKVPVNEMTIDQLARLVGMTVRNVRAYTSRGLVPPPRLVGRTGYYGEEHADRLRLVRDLVDRGYTLGAVEKALSENAAVADSHALDLFALLANPLGQPQASETLPIATLARLAGVDLETQEALLPQLEELKLVEELEKRRSAGRSAPALRDAPKVLGSGSILNDRNWTPLLNDSFILGGVHGNREFHFAEDDAGKYFDFLALRDKFDPKQAA